MILVIGGLSAGKREFVRRELGYAPEQMSPCLEGGAPVLYDLQNISPVPDAGRLEGYEVVVCNEVGCGLVPVDREEREHREAVGRLCCDLAQASDRVYRVSCGIGMRLK